MSTKLLLVASIIAASTMVLDVNDAQAQGRCNQGYSNFGQSAQIYGYPANRVSGYSGYSMGYGNRGGYGFPSQNIYSSGYGYGGGNRYMSGYGNYGYPSRGGISVGIGTGGFGNRGYGGYRGFGF